MKVVVHNDVDPEWKKTITQHFSTRLKTKQEEQEGALDKALMENMKKTREAELNLVKVISRYHELLEELKTEINSKLTPHRRLEV